MNFLEPIGLASLALLIPIVALYFLKLKREERIVPSTLLWKKVIDDMQVNAPFQRLKYSLLLLLQLLLVALLAFALARPYLNLGGRAGIKTLMLIDTSASMATRDAGADGSLTRLEAAIRDAEAKLGDMRGSDETMLVAFDRDVRQLSKFSSDRGMLRTALANLQTRDVETRASEALESALSLCEGQTDARILVLSDGCFGNLRAPNGATDEPVKGNTEDQGGGANLTPIERMEKRLGSVRFVSYGKEESDNIGITQIDARTRPIKTTDDNGKRVDALETQLFVMVENFSTKPREVVLGISTEGTRFPTKVIRLQGRPARNELLEDDPVATNADASRSVEVFRLPVGTTGVVTAKIEAPKDRMPIDDTAQVVVGQAEGAKVLLVTKGNYFLEKALSSMRGVTVLTQSPEEFQKGWDQQAQASVEGYDLSIFENVAPLNWTDGGALFLGTMPPLPGFAKAEKPLVEWPRVVDWDVAHPVMRYVNFGNVTVAKGEAWKVPKTARQIVEGDEGPLIVATENDRVRAVAVSFDIFQSDWVYRPALPLFLRNVVPWLAEASPRRHPVNQHTGEPLAVPAGLFDGVATLVRPGGQTPEKLQLTSQHSTYIKGTETAGLYELKDLPLPRVYAVNLASRNESDNRAQGSLRIGSLVKESTPSSIEAKREIWRDLAIAAALLLLLEWWVFHRRVGM